MGSHSRTRSGSRIGRMVAVAVVAVLLLGGAAAAGVIFTRGHGSAPTDVPNARGQSPAPQRSMRPVHRLAGPQSDALPRSPGAKPCTTVRVLASMEDHDLLSALAQAYRGDRRDVSGHCVSVSVDTTPSGDAASEAEAGFADKPEAARPTIWWPDSSDWLSVVHAETSVVPDHGTSVAQTPVVLALPAPQVAALGWNRHPPTWQDYLRLAADPDVWAKRHHADWGTFKVGETSPQTATSGLDEMVAAYGAASGKPNDLTPHAIDSASVQATVHAGERTTAHYGASEDHFLAHVRAAQATGEVANFLSVVTLDEKSVWNFNRGHIDPAAMRAMGGMGGMTGMSGPPKEPLVPIYPKDGTYVADNPAAVLGGSWVSPVQQKAAADLIRFAKSSTGQQVVRASGYRDLSDKVDPQVAKTGRYHDGSIAVRPDPPADVLAAVQKAFPAVRKRARVLFAIDVSNSMNAVLPDGHTKLQEAQQAAVKALKYFSDDDQVGVAAFSNQPHQQNVTPGVLAPVAPLSRDRSQVIQKIDDLTTVDQTPLYRAVPQFVSTMISSYSSDDINAIVLLSDGTNDTDASGTMSSLTNQVTTAIKSKPVRIFTLGYGADADAPTLRRISELTGAHYYDATNPDTISAVLSDLVTNF